MVTDYFLKSISEDIFKHQITQVVPYEFYLGLSSTAPSTDGSGVTEPTDEAYHRARIVNSEETLSTADSSTGIVLNHTAVYLPESTEPWPGLTHYVIYDSETNGNLLMYGPLNATMNVPIKTIVGIPVGDLKIKTSNV